MKKVVCLLLIAAMLTAMSVSVFADSAAYIRYIASGKAVAGSATHTSNTNVTVKQTSNVNTETGEVGPTIYYTARKSNTTSGSSICDTISISGSSGTRSGAYTSIPTSGSTVYLVVQPATAATTGQWEIAGTWNP